KNRCTILSGWMGDAIGFMIPVNVFPSVETILHGSGWLRQGLVAYYRSSMLQVRGVACILIATSASAAPTETPDTLAVAEIQVVLHAQQDAWNRGDIDGFMDGYARSPSTVFISEDEVRRGWETVRQRYHDKYSDRTKMGTLSFSDIEITPISSEAA